MKRILLVIFLLFLLGFGLFTYFGNTKKTTTALINLIQQNGNKSVSPTPFPFEELTIPYLRQRSYSSTLSLLEKSYENPNYTAFFTSYKSDRLKVNGMLTIPTGQKPTDGWPAIIFIHGYVSPRQYQQLTQYYDYVDFLARNGFVVFKIDLRGHANSEGEAGGGYYSSGYIVDTLNAYAALQAAGFVTKNAIGLWGHSMAGNVVMRSIAAKPEIKAIVIWAGAVYSYIDQQKYGIRDASYSPQTNNTARINKRRELFEKVGSPSAQSAFWQKVAPTNYLNDLKGAIQINHAINDDVVNIGYSRDLMKLLDQTSVPHELHEYASGGHNISGESFTQSMERTVAFFKKYLK